MKELDEYAIDVRLARLRKGAARLGTMACLRGGAEVPNESSAGSTSIASTPGAGISVAPGRCRKMLLPVLRVRSYSARRRAAAKLMVFGCIVRA